MSNKREWFRNKRNARGLSLEKLARLADASTSTVVKIERGESMPTLELALRLSEILEFDPKLFCTDITA